MLNRIWNLFIGNKNLEDLAPELLKTIAETYKWQWAVYWRVDPRTKVLSAAKIWKTPSLQAAELEAETTKLSLASGEGLLGRAWSLGQVVWSDDPAMDMGYPRSQKARAAGFNRGVWIPVQSPTASYGVLEFLITGPEERHEVFIEELEWLGRELARLCEEARGN